MLEFTIHRPWTTWATCCFAGARAKIPTGLRHRFSDEKAQLLRLGRRRDHWHARALYALRRARASMWGFLACIEHRIAGGVLWQ